MVQIEERLAILTGRSFLLEPAVEARGAIVPHLVEILIQCPDLRGVEALQKLGHRSHDIGMGIERSSSETDIHGMIRAITFHQLAAATKHADRKAAAKRLAVGDEIGLDAEVFLAPPRARRKPTKTSSKISAIPRSVANRRGVVAASVYRQRGRTRRGANCQPARNPPAPAR